MTIYRPYFYIIRHIPTSKYYVGSKFGKDATPLNLMKPDGYHTSSNLVSNIIKEYGLDSFEICRIRVFDTAEQAYIYETRFLRRVHASVNITFINAHENQICTYGTESFYRIMMKSHGVRHFSQHPSHKEKTRQTCLEKYGNEVFQRTSVFREKVSRTSTSTYGTEWPIQNVDVQNKRKSTNIEKYGVSNAALAQNVIEKTKATNVERYGVEYAIASEHNKSKTKRTLKSRYGEHITNVAQTPDARNKITSKKLEYHAIRRADQELQSILFEIKQIPRLQRVEWFGRNYHTYTKERLIVLLSEFRESD